MNKRVVYVVYYVLYFIDIIISVPPLYCMHRFNSSDCRGAPTPVFSYYKPGSRCEIEIWRGCPTMNMFDDEYQCSHYCIGKFLNSSSGSLPLKQSTCYEIFNTSKCTTEVVKVYTYNRKNKICETAVWRGCNTGNKFPDKSTCTSTCKSNDKEEGFEKKLNKLIPNDAKKLDSILDFIIAKDKEELKYVPSIQNTTEHIVSKVPVTQSTVSNSHIEDTNVTTSESTTSGTNIRESLTSSPITIATTIFSEPSTIIEETTSKLEFSTSSIRPSGTVEEVVVPDVYN